VHQSKAQSQPDKNSAAPPYGHTWYDDVGNLVSVERVNADRSIDVAWSFSYDRFGNKLSQTLDREGDGVIEERTVYEYDCWQ
jgi:hypothetical protein